MNPGLVVKLRPSGPWRIGPDSGARNRVDAIYHSDSLYSAVTSAMSRMGSLSGWLDATARSQTPAVCFSSCFPFLDDIALVVPPRTIWPPTSPGLVSARVRWKSARFIPLSVVESILSGKRLNENQWSVDGASGCLVPAGKPGPFRTSVRWNAAVDRLSGCSERHATACIEFREGCGLWTVVGFHDDEARDQWQDAVKAAFRLLADTGFGGERSRGWGRSETPEFVEGTLPGLIIEYRRQEPPVEVEEPPVEEPPVKEAPMVEPPPAEEPLPEREPPVESEAAALETEGAALATQSAVSETEVAASDMVASEEDEIAVGLDEVVVKPDEVEVKADEAAVEPDEVEVKPEEVMDDSEMVAAEQPVSGGDTTAEPAPEVAAAESRSGAEEEESPSFARIDRLKAAPPAAVVRARDLTEPMRLATEREAGPAVSAPAVHLQAHWLLSLFTPAAADAVDWARGSYTVLARGGRIDSPSGSGELKKQIQMVAEGSVLYADGVPLGAAPDVAPDGFAHPVFRAGFALAIPLPEVH